jgi:hypothetical protein
MATATVQTAATPEAVRQERGRQLAQTARITRKRDGVYVVPASAGQGHYTVHIDPSGDRCTCPDHELRGIRCKHSWAVEYSRRSTTMADGSQKVVETLKVTYRQEWAAYNQAQTRELEHAPEILHALCAGLAEEPQTNGRPRLPLADRVFAVTMKVYGGMAPAGPTRRCATLRRVASSRRPRRGTP